MDYSLTEVNRMSEIVLTPAALLDLLSKIDELSQYNLGLTESISGGLQLQIGNSIYNIDAENAVDVKVSDEVVDTVGEVNSEAYDNIEESEDYIESGIIKELAKTLLIGGLVRLSGKLLRNDGKDR